MGDMPWVIQINDELNNMPNTNAESEQWSRRSIYRVSARLADLNRTSLISRESYKPQLVSIGPYHHGDESLRLMEEHKRRALLHFLKISDKPLKSFVDALVPVMQELKDAYDEFTDTSWYYDTEGFLELMTTDGCFILEILRIFSMSNTFDDLGYAANDPIFSSHGMFYIPMLVLERLYTVQNAHSSKLNLTNAIMKFFSPIPVKRFGESDKFLHILDLYRNCLLGDRRTSESRIESVRHFNIDRGADEIVRSATELIESGIRIKRSRTIGLNGISFVEQGVLTLPPIVVDDALESIYLNLIAFERFHVGAGNEITSYIFLMDNMICTPRDVRLLHSCGIIHNALGSEEAVANLFNSLSRDVSIDPGSSLDEVHKSVDLYLKKPLNKYMYSLRHVYFNTPWALISVVNAVCIIILTIVQTVGAFN